MTDQITTTAEALDLAVDMLDTIAKGGSYSTSVYLDNLGTLRHIREHRRPDGDKDARITKLTEALELISNMTNRDLMLAITHRPANLTLKQRQRLGVLVLLLKTRLKNLARPGRRRDQD